MYDTYTKFLAMLGGYGINDIQTTDEQRDKLPNDFEIFIGLKNIPITRGNRKDFLLFRIAWGDATQDIINPDINNYPSLLTTNPIVIKMNDTGIIMEDLTNASLEAYRLSDDYLYYITLPNYPMIELTKTMFRQLRFYEPYSKWNDNAYMKRTEEGAYVFKYHPGPSKISLDNILYHDGIEGELPRRANLTLEEYLRKEI